MLTANHRGQRNKKFYFFTSSNPKSWPLIIEHKETIEFLGTSNLNCWPLIIEDKETKKNFTSSNPKSWPVIIEHKETMDFLLRKFFKKYFIGQNIVENGKKLRPQKEYACNCPSV